MTLHPEFSRLLTQYLARHDRSPAWLARRLDVHPGTVSRWLNQLTRPATPELVIRVADLLGVHTPTERHALLAAAGFAYQEGAPTGAPDAPVQSPPQPVPAPLQQSHSRLPLASTSFVGREKELAQLAQHFADPATRLVTIVGMGGIGKSRLAVEAAARLQHHFADGVCFVALAPVTSTGLIPAAIAAALGVPLQGATDLEAHLFRYLAGRQLLLILDNLEHLPDAAHLVERILQTAPAVRVLATSRVRLRLDQEWLFSLDGLTVPPSLDAANPSAADHTAVDLFVQRARRLQPDFTLSPETAPGTATEVIRICRLVGGMPLAIELAAAWLRAVPLAEIAAEIESNLDFLTTSMRNVSERHRSMSAVFDHSWQLLEERERNALRRISVFRGGFTRYAAAEVAGAGIRTLAGLVDSSWIQLDAHGRYEIHELARQYAEQQLESDSSVAADARDAHCAYYAAFADRIGGSEGTIYEHADKLNSLVLELDNLWAGWRWGEATRNFGELGKYVTPLEYLADSHGLYSEVVEAFEQLSAQIRKSLAGIPVSDASYRPTAVVQAQVLNALCYLYGRTISVELGIARGAESIDLLRQFVLDGRISDGRVSDEGSAEVLSHYLWALMYMSLVTGKYADYRRARLCCEEMIDLTRGKSEYLAFYCKALNALSQTAYLQGSFAEAESLLTECLAQTPDYIVLAVGNDRLAHVYADMGDRTRATGHAAAAVTLAQKGSNRPTLAAALITQANLAIAQGEFEEAESYLERSFEIAEETGNQYVRVRFLTSKASLARLQSRPVEAQEMYAQAYALAEQMARKKDAALAQAGIGFSLLDQEKFEEAETYFRAALQAAWERKIMPEVIWAVVGLAALKGNEGDLQRGQQWLQCAIAHPSCPMRVQVEAAAIRTRLTLPEADRAPGAEHLRDPDTALEAVVLELLQ